jgi:hypothetical protein
MPHLPLDVPVRYSRGLSVFLIAMCAISAVILAAIGMIEQ